MKSKNTSIICLLILMMLFGQFPFFSKVNAASDLTQIHYHWRNDDGSESGASSRTGGTEDTAIINVVKNSAIRLRIEVSNEGDTASTSQYRLEYGEKSTDCASIGAWVDVGAVDGDWDMSNSTNLTDGSNTTDIAIADGGVSNENTTFETPNSAVKDIFSQAGSITLSSTEFVEIEYSIEALDNASASTTYCFRVTNAGVALPSYSVYPQATIRANKDFSIQRGVVTISGTSATITAGTDYTTPSASSSAFVRITNTQHTGAGHDSGGGSQNADAVTVYISNPSNIENGITFTRFGGSNNTRVSWEIVEYIGPSSGDNEMIVRGQGVTTFSSSGLTASSSVSGVVNDSDVVVFITGQGNPDVGTNDYNTGLVTASWSGSSDEAVLTRGETGNDAIKVSWSVVEFTGGNWGVQRAEHNYSQSLNVETESITSVNDLNRAFIHAQKRVGSGLGGVDEFGHEVWLSSVGVISLKLQNGANNPSAHTAVVWVIENTQTSGTPMIVTRSNGVQAGGSEPSFVNVNIGKTLSDLSVASIFTNNRASSTDTSFPRPMMGVRLISTTQYELWISDTGNDRTYRTEVVEWPTAIRILTQNYYRFYVDNNALDPTDPWPEGGTDLGENTSITVNDSPPSSGDVVRIRMSIKVDGANLSASSTAFKLQFGQRDITCSAISLWRNVGGIGSSTALWRGYDASPSDGTALSGDPPTGGDLNLSVSDRAGSYEEQNNSVGNPFKIFMGEDVEYDWIVENNNATDQTVYCFRVIESDGTELDIYNFYPALMTADYELNTQNWRWYDDETNETPSSPLAGENVAPSNIENDNVIKLRITAKEMAGRNGSDVKLKLQFSEYSDFSSDVIDVVAIGDCATSSLWCYSDGAGNDNATITSKVLSDADSCSGGVGSGCGTHNETGTVASEFFQEALAATEFEFTIEHAAARVNTVYFFRLYDVTNDTVISASSTATYPSLSTEGSELTFSINGVASSTVTEGITTDVDTTSTSISFGSLTLDTETEAAQKLTVSTNSTGGYKIFVFQRQDLLSSFGSEINPVTGTNESPSGWSSGCVLGATGCYGYHSGDDSLEGGSTRFFAVDTYAKFETSSKEVAYSSGPVTNESTDIIYKIEAQDDQAAGIYSSSIVYVVVPTF